MRPIVLFRLAACLAVFATPALSAETKADEAKRHFVRSKELYEEGDFSGALNELERAYTTVPNFKLLYNIAQAQVQLQNYAAALKSFKRYLVDGGNEVPESRRTEVLKEVDKLRTRVAELTLVAADGAELAVDDVVVGKAPLAEPVTVNVGHRKVTATLSNYFPLTKYVDVTGLDSVNVKLELRPVMTQPQGKPEATASAAPAQGSGRLPVWVPWALAGGLGAGAVVTGVLALGASKQETTLLATYGLTTSQLNAAVSKTKTFALVTDILIGCAAAAGVGALLYTLLRPADPPPAVSLGFTGSALVLQGAF